METQQYFLNNYSESFAISQYTSSLNRNVQVCTYYKQILQQADVLSSATETI